MRTKLEIKNVVYAESCTRKKYPMWADYGVLVLGCRVVWLEGDEYKSGWYSYEEYEEIDAYDLYLEKASHEDICKYKEHIENEIINKSKEEEHSWDAIAGDVIEVIRGRKYPIGSRYVVQKEYTYYDQYHRPQGYYWVTTTGERIQKHNCVIVSTDRPVVFEYRRYIDYYHSIQYED
jgi:hypothetical protein